LLRTGFQGGSAVRSQNQNPADLARWWWATEALVAPLRVALVGLDLKIQVARADYTRPLKFNAFMNMARTLEFQLDHLAGQ